MLQVLKVLEKQGEQWRVGGSLRRHLHDQFTAETGVAETAEVAPQGSEGVFQIAGIDADQSGGGPFNVDNLDMRKRFKCVDKSLLTAPGSLGDACELPLVFGEEGNQAV